MQSVPAPCRHALWPTPIQPLPRLSERLGVRLYCKRDDLSGFGFGCNKTRKLEYLVADALRAGADALVTCGSNQSNWCAATAVAGAAAGLDVYLVLGGATPSVDTGNVRLNRLAGAKISHVDTSDDATLETCSAELADSLRARGRTPYRMPMGGSTRIGAQGYIRAREEILAWEQAHGLRFSHLVHATGSGGTQAGLVAGGHARGRHGDVIGMAVSRDAQAQTAKVRQVLCGLLDESTAATLPLQVDDRFVGDGYRQPSRDAEDAIALFARLEGIFLDEVYTGKAAAGLIAWCREARFDADDHVLFVHTGGAVQLFE